MKEQLYHDSSQFIKKQFPITLVSDGVSSPANIGSLFRLSDSFGVEKIYFCGKEISIVSKRMIRTARSTHHIIPYQQKDNITDIIKQLIAENYIILTLEITKNSIPVSDYKPKHNQKIALIIGEENIGVSEKILSMATQSIHINMYGNNSSMNVATATAIALYEITNNLSIK